MKYFIRALEVSSLSVEKRSYVVNLGMSLIDQHVIIKNAGKSISRQLQPIEELFKLIAEFPELISQYPRFRNVCRNKIIEIIKTLNSKNMQIPHIIEDMPEIFKLIEIRSDYVKDKTVTPKHSYNLRSRK